MWYDYRTTGRLRCQHYVLKDDHTVQERLKYFHPSTGHLQTSEVENKQDHKKRDNFV